MKILSIPFESIVIPEDRQRVEFDEAAILELAGSISTDGLFHPLLVRIEDGETVLVAGWRRLKALEHLWFLGDSVRVGEQQFPENHAPCIQLGDLDTLSAYRVELEENLRRENLSWQDSASAAARLAELIRSQAESQDLAEPTLMEMGTEIYHQSSPTSDRSTTLREDIILARNLSDPDVAKAASRKDALKILDRKETARQNAAHAQAVGRVFSSADHILLKGDSLELMATLPDSSFDVILSDPPYGMSADEFGDSGGLAAGAHFYDDSHATWIRLMSGLAVQLDRITKPQAHLYLFCDIDRFSALRDFVSASTQWKVFRTPLIWFNPGGSRAPWPEQGPQRKWQAILYAVRGGRPVTRLYGDVISCTTDTNLGHPAQKPVALLRDLLQRSCRAGDSVLDPFAGSGSIFPAAHSLKVKATGIELDEAAFGIAAKRLKELT